MKNPLMGVPATDWLQDGNLAYRLNHIENNCDEIQVTMSQGRRSEAALAEKTVELQRMLQSHGAVVESLAQTIDSLEHWFPRWGDPDGANSQMMKNARAALTSARAVEPVVNVS